MLDAAKLKKALDEAANRRFREQTRAIEKGVARAERLLANTGRNPGVQVSKRPGGIRVSYPASHAMTVRSAIAAEQRRI